MKRSLVLAGGGMRVAWQAGVLKALEEEGIGYDHVDGTSGGILNTAMLLSGLRADEMMARWARVNVRNFSSVLPLREYLKGPWNLPALSGPEGITGKLFPAMGVDVATIRASATPGTFNIANFTEKRSIAVDSAQIDAQLLAAGMSLPIFMTPLHRDGATWTDAAWIRDANVAEALERGAQEIWLVWCVGNSPYWGDGPLEQYVHMIEMSAAGGLLADFELARAAGRDFVLHVIKPEYPLPLDPAFYLGRISATTLMGMGYRDAVGYLEGRSETGVPADHTCTQMSDPPPGASWNEHLVGEAAAAELTVWLPARRGPEAAVTGFITLPGQPHPLPLAAGRLVDQDGGWDYEGRVRLDGRWEPVTIRRDAAGRGIPRLDQAVLRVAGRQHELRLGRRQLLRLLFSVEPFGAHGVLRRVGAAVAVLARIGGGLLRSR